MTMEALALPTVRVHNDVDGTDHDVTAIYRRGVWAVTAGVKAGGVVCENTWTVTHVPTGVSATGRVGVSSDDAIRLCRAYADWCVDWGADAEYSSVPTVPAAMNAIYNAWRASL